MSRRRPALPDTPLHPDELETYKTDVQTEAEAEDEDLPTPGQDARPWLGFGLGLLVVFLAALVASLLFALNA